MKTPSFRFIFSILVTWLFIQPMVAQPPSLVNFRGQLLDNSNQPVTDTVSVGLKIFASETGGSALYTEEIGNIEVKNGQYAFQFGSAGTTDFAGVIQANAETWVEVSINNIPLSRQRFVSVPYALNAGSSYIAPGVITMAQLSQEVRDDINRTITKSMLSQEVLTEITQSSGRRSEKYDFVRLNIDPSSTEQTQRVVPAITPPNSAGISSTEVILFDYLELQEGEAAHVVTVPEDAVNLLLLINGTEVFPYWTREYDSSAMRWGDSPKKNSIVGPGNLYAAFLSVGTSTTPEKSSVTLAVDRIGYNQHEYVKLIAGPNEDPYVYAEGDHDHPSGPRKFYRFGNGVTLNEGDTAQIVGISGRIFNLLLDTGTALFSHPAMTYDYSTTPFTSRPNFTNLITGVGQLYVAGEVDPGETLGEAVRSIDLKIIRASQAGDSSGNGGATTVIENGTITREMLDDELRDDLNFSAFQSAHSLSSLYMPYGYDGEPVVGGNEYTVPEGKVLAIMDAGFNPSGVSGNSEILVQHENTYFWVSRPGEIVLVDQNKSLGVGRRNNGVFYPESNRGFVGLLFDSVEHITPVHGTTSNFTVPTGKKLVITSNLGWIEIDSIPISSDDIVRDFPIIVGDGITLNLRSNDGRHGFSGYLIDQNRSLGGGLISSTDQTSASTSVTPSMLSDSILKYLMPEIVEQPTFTGTIRNGTRVELNPGVEGKYISYQWYKDGEPIDGATSQLFTIESFDVGYHDGNYTVVASNDFGEIESAVIELVEQQSNNQNLGNIFPSFLSDWTDLSNSQAIGSFFGVAIGENAIVACGIDGLIAVRNHESGSWETPVSGGDPDFRDVVFADNKFIAVGESGMIRTSQDGYSWTTVTSNPSYDLRCIVWDGGKFIIGASDGRILKSYDGTNWEATDTGHSITFNAIAYNGSAYIAVGGYGMVYSSDLINWSVPTSPPPSFSIESAAWTGDRFLVGGLNDKIYQSTDGQNWTVAFSHNGGFAESISSNGGATYVVGGSNFILSYDSESGNFVESNTDLDGNNALMDVSINGPNIVAVGFNHTIIGKSLHTQPSTHIVDLNSTVSLEMIWVEPGTFMMGSPETEEGRVNSAGKETQHEVTLTKGFYLGKYEVTQAQYEAVMLSNIDGLSATPSYYAGNANRPVEQVSWDDSQVFIELLNFREAVNLPTGWQYALPTSAQWEFACRAGTTTAFYWGDTFTSDLANADNTQGGTTNVGSFNANAWGFFDMHGNVMEWTADWFGPYTNEAAIDPMGPTSGTFRVTRSGHWGATAPNARSANRANFGTELRHSGYGFRVALREIE